MDLICPVCGEPWDFDTLHEEAQERYGVTPRTDKQRAEYDRVFSEVSGEFRAVGCRSLRAIRGTDQSCEPPAGGSTRAALAGAAYEVMGEDLDGAAAMLEDYGA